VFLLQCYICNRKALLTSENQISKLQHLQACTIQSLNCETQNHLQDDDKARVCLGGLKRGSNSVLKELARFFHCRSVDQILGVATLSCNHNGRLWRGSSHLLKKNYPRPNRPNEMGLDEQGRSSTSTSLSPTERRGGHPRWGKEEEEEEAGRRGSHHGARTRSPAVLQTPRTPVSMKGRMLAGEGEAGGGGWRTRSLSIDSILDWSVPLSLPSVSPLSGPQFLANF
jgi:hypothetical protein